MVGTGYPLSARPGGVPWAIIIKGAVEGEAGRGRRSEEHRGTNIVYWRARPLEHGEAIKYCRRVLYDARSLVTPSVAAAGAYTPLLRRICQGSCVHDT